MSKGFLPADDQGLILVFTEAAQDVSFMAIANMQRQVAEIVKENPYVQGAMSSVGAGGPSASLNVGRIFVALKPRNQRPSADVVIQQLRGPLARVTGIKAYVQNIPAIRIGGQVTKSSYQYTLQGTDTDELYQWAPKVEEKLRSLPGLVDVLRSGQGVFERTGGLHAAGLFDADGRLIALREDVGRHNAVDKVVGRLFLDGRLPASGTILVVSGRAGYEIVQKSIGAGVPVLAAVGAPSSLAVALAREFNQTLVGFLRGDRFNVYSGADRLAKGAKASPG